MHTISVISAFISSLLLLFLSIFVLVKDWRDQINRYYALYSMSLFGVLACMFFIYTFTDTPYMTVISRIGQVCALLIFSATFILSLAFPKGEKRVPFY
ncbi:MAG: hypothetical protein SVR08_11575, partial [Spirochaetota bacterium]|nr:hypothetical protein [Spirochaetota bacterium]